MLKAIKRLFEPWQLMAIVCCPVDWKNNADTKYKTAYIEYHLYIKDGGDKRKYKIEYSGDYNSLLPSYTRKDRAYTRIVLPWMKKAVSNSYACTWAELHEHSYCFMKYLINHNLLEKWKEDAN